MAGARVGAVPAASRFVPGRRFIQIYPVRGSEGRAGVFVRDTTSREEGGEK